MGKRQFDLSVADEINIQTILTRFPYLRGNVTAAISLALFELAAKITVEGTKENESDDE